MAEKVTFPPSQSLSLPNIETCVGSTTVTFTAVSPEHPEASYTVTA